LNRPHGLGGEVGGLVLYRMRCPLMGVAARHTDDQGANFDIYLPEWLARNNKQIFGTCTRLPCCSSWCVGSLHDRNLP
jgi:hypothetical protein